MQVDDFNAVRAGSVALIEGLSPEDCQVQSMPDASPAKWHLAHTTWFFETFVLAESYGAEFRELFNSYYHSVGPMHARGARGLLTRPSLAEVLEYRAWVDERVRRVIGGDKDELIELGLHHEQQHQELLLTDLLHAFAQNPLLPAYRTAAAPRRAPALLSFTGHDGGLVDIGATQTGFAFDNERPRHRAYLHPYELANRPVTNAEYREFIDAGGYGDARLWLSDGWLAAQTGDWHRPLYWMEDDESAFTLAGVQPLDPHAPVCHISHYEADAYARWANARLPTEFEWEAADPPAAGAVWEWTSSAYLPYPGFKPAVGDLGEYNGKFMSGQMVLRGGSSATPAGHSRRSYRNFFPPDARWQFSGVRVARDR